MTYPDAHDATVREIDFAYVVFLDARLIGASLGRVQIYVDWFG